MGNRNEIIIKTSVRGIIANILLVLAKGIVGFFTNSIAIILEAVNNLTDVISSIITIIGTKLAGRAPDREHPYGHGRIEYIATLAVGIIITATGFGALIDSIPKIITPPAVRHSLISIFVMLASIIVKLLIGLHYRKVSKTIDSDTLSASGTDALFDAIISTSTLVSIVINLLTGANLEGYLACAISIFIVKAGFDVLLESWRDLIGRRVDSELSVAIKKRISKFPNVSGVYDLMLHNYGPLQVIGSVSIQVPDTMTAKELHKLTRDISECIFSEFRVILTIGIYAENTDTPKHRKIRSIIESTIANYPEISQMHGFYVDDSRKTVAFDIIFDFSCPHKTRIKNRLIRNLHNQLPDHQFLITIDIDVSD